MLAVNLNDGRLERDLGKRGHVNWADVTKIRSGIAIESRLGNFVWQGSIEEYRAVDATRPCDTH